MENNLLAGLFEFRDATRQQAKASILIEGLTGKGKSGLALAIGYQLAKKNWAKVFAVDTESKSLDLFEGLTMHVGDKCAPFKKVDLLPMHGFKPSNFLLCKENAITAGAEVIINDSITHMWIQTGGVLELVQLAEKKPGMNKYTSWGDPAVLTEKQHIYAVARDARIHVINTVRVKEKFEMVTGEGLKSLGEQEIMMPDFKYEPDLVLHMLSPGNQSGKAPVARVIKSRYAIFQEGEQYQFTEDVIQTLVDYLAEGTDPAELLEKQRLDLINTITKILDSDVSKQSMFPMLKEQQGHANTALKDLPMGVMQTILGILLA